VGGLGSDFRISALTEMRKPSGGLPRTGSSRRIGPAQYMRFTIVRARGTKMAVTKERMKQAFMARVADIFRGPVP